MKLVTYISTIAMPAIIFIIVLFGLLEKNKVFDIFLEGAKDGIKIVYNIFPTLIGLFVANNGGNKTKKEVKAPRQQVDQVRYSIKDNVNVVISKDNNVEVNDILNNKINLPAGFKISNDSPLTVEEGIVVEDENGNQFVWIPVGKIITKNDEEKEINKWKNIRINL